MARIAVHFLPSLVSSAALSDGAVVVIDALRATTTIVHALAAGALQVRPCLEVDEARQLAAKLAPSQVVLGGERQGIRIDGFDLGNSPTEYSANVVAGRTVIFTTTNGTRAMLHAAAAKTILIGAFVNRRAIVDALADEPTIHLLCAGTRGEITREDVLAAGAIVDGLAPSGAGLQLNDQAVIARDAWRAAVPLVAYDNAVRLTTELVAALRDSEGGRNLIAEGFEPDIATASQMDRFRLVPIFDPRTGTVTCAKRPAG